MEDLKTNRSKLKRKSSRSLSKLGLRSYKRETMSCRRKIMPSVLHRAEELRSKLEAKCPSFTKPLVKSHVTGCFWMGLPVSFCKKHLPQNDTYFILESPNGKKYQAHYLATKTAISGGWRGFAMAESLSEGDVLVFHLVSPAKFKVYITRQCDSSEVDGAPVMLNMDTEKCGLDTSVGTVEQYMTTAQQTSSPSTVVQDKDQEMLLSDYCQKIMQRKERLGSSNPKVSSENSKSVELPPAAVLNYNDITSFEDFILLIEELLKKEYELPHHIKWSYYQLCCCQNVLLHAHLPKGMNPILIAGIIIETVSIASAVRNCELPTFHDEFAIWDKSLKSLEILGMNVGFLRTHLHHLRRIVDDPQAAMYRQQCMDLCSKHADAEKEIKNLQSKLSELTRESDKRAADIEKLKSEIENHEVRFQEQVSAPW